MDTQLHNIGAEDEDETTNQKFEEINIKEEPLEETSQDCELYGSVLESVKKEECVSDNDEQSDKEYENPITENKDIRKTKYLRKFGCFICNKSFTRKETLKLHLKIHSGIKEYECGVCKKLFTLRGYLKRHMEVHAEPNVVKDVSYSTCKISIPRIRSPKIREIKEYKCTICNKQFAYECYLTRHMKVHSYNCTICNRQFEHRNRYLLHLKIHSGTKDCHCSVCGKAFVDNSYLKRHLKIHSRENILP